MLHIQHLSPSIAGTLAAPIVRSHNCVIPFIVQNDIKMWLTIQNFLAITKSATLDLQQLSQAPSLWLEKHHIAVLNQTQKKCSNLWIKAFVNNSCYHVIKRVAE